MFSRFFIHRPIFASVLSIIITLGGGIAVWVLPVAQYPEITPPTVEVSASYPGADSQVVADTVAAPIEQQVNGVEGMLYMSSQCTNDGTYTLTVTFKLGVDLNMAQVLVQNRVAMALPVLPDLVNRKGVTVKKKVAQRADDRQPLLTGGAGPSSSRSTAWKACSTCRRNVPTTAATRSTVTFKLGIDLNMAQVLVQNRVAMALPILPDLVNRKGVTVKKKSPNVLMIVNLFSPPEPGHPEGIRNNLYLSNYATIQIRDELSRIPGVGDVTYLGQRDYSMRIWLNPQEMAYRGLRPATWSWPSSSRTPRWPPARSGSRRCPRGRNSSTP